ncbi:MAG: hypothetical protein ABSE72_12435 [Bacteroidales bacterium]|jgi:hypothetical protein
MNKKTKKIENVTKKFDFRTIKSFEDACKKTGYDPSVAHLPLLPKEFGGALIAVLKLFIIFKAINNGWTPNWDDSNQFKYYPWFKVRSSGSGFGFSGSDYDYDHTCTAVGSRLCTDTSEKALYIGKQFEKEYEEFFLSKK